MKKIFTSLFLIIFAFILSSCVVPPNSNNNNNNNNNVFVDETPDVIEDEHLERPSTSKLVYNDYATVGNLSDHNDSKWYYNEVHDLNLPDPFVYTDGETYYIYGTTDRTSSRSIDCYETIDFHTFKHYPDVYRAENGGWEKSGDQASCFAPEMIKYNDKYYLTYSADGTNGFRYISVAVADSPTGPFKPYKGYNANGEYIDGFTTPIFDHLNNVSNTRLSVLDQTMFLDDNGQLYMYYSVYDQSDSQGISGHSQYVVGIRLKNPVTPEWNTYKVLVWPTLAWEKYNNTGFYVIEGPQMIKSPVNKKYYLTYTVNHYTDRYYTVCYAVSNFPLGEFTKPNTGKEWSNLIFGYAGPKSGTVYNQWEGYMSGTGHHCFFKSGEQWMIGYHAHKNRKDIRNGRCFAFDYIHFDESGVPYGEGPTSVLQPLPEAISGYRNIALDATIETIGIDDAEKLIDNYIVSHYHLPQYYNNREVTLPADVSYAILDFGQDYYIGGISIYNSSQYDKLLYEIDFINFFNGNVITDLQYSLLNYDDNKEFAYPGGAFVIDFKEFKASKVIICFNLAEEAQINEIRVFGREA